MNMVTSSKENRRGGGGLTRDDLDEIRSELENLLPAVIPEPLAGAVPILVPLR